MPEGVVKWFNPLKGFGFIVRDEGGGDLYVHHSVLQRAGLDGLREAQRVFYELGESGRGESRVAVLRVA